MIRKVLISAAMLLGTDAWAIGYAYQQGQGLELSWQTDDRVGVTTGNATNGEMEQLSFWASSKAAASRNDRSLYAVGYQLKPNLTYYSYSPYKWSEAFDARAIQCRYDQQKQTGNDDPSGIVKYDYQMAAATSSSDAISFSYKHIGGVLRISFLAPAAMAVASLNLTTETAALATKATMDLISQKVGLGEYATTMTLETANVSVAKSEKVVLYLALPAQDLSANKLRIAVRDSNGKEFPLATVMAPNVKAGCLYEMALLDSPQTQATPRLTVRESAPQRVAGIANPLAHVEDIQLDNTYSMQYVHMVKKGDVNGDGDVDVLDAIALIGYYTKGRTAELSPSVCDMNNDGDIDVLDAIEIVGRYTKGGS